MSSEFRDNIRSETPTEGRELDAVHILAAEAGDHFDEGLF